MREFALKFAGAICAVALACQTAWACESAPAAEAFIYLNDANLDGALDRSEWRNAKVSDNFILGFSEFSEEEFKRLDTNKDRKLEWDKDGLFEKIEYKKDPCEMFYENLENNETKP